jgi:hypothetical protein
LRAPGQAGSGLRGTVLPATLCSAAAFALLALVVVPGLTPVWLSPQIAERFAAVKACPDSRLVAVGYHEPSLVFLAGTETLLTDPKGAAEALAADPACDVAVVDESGLAAFAAALPGGIDAVEAVGVVEGVNYSKGAPRTLRFFRMRR